MAWSVTWILAELAVAGVGGGQQDRTVYQAHEHETRPPAHNLPARKTARLMSRPKQAPPRRK